jgi:hypothetical protein
MKRRPNHGDWNFRALPTRNEVAEDEWLERMKYKKVVQGRNDGKRDQIRSGVKSVAAPPTACVEDFHLFTYTTIFFVRD